jgi:hypothetical protein
MNMNSYIKHRSAVIAVFGIFVGLLVCSVPEVYAANANPGVLPPYAKPYGMTYGEWSAKWYQWQYSLPVDQHPLFDTADCNEGQTGAVWFLGGTFTVREENGSVIGEAQRDCAIPVGKALFFPILNGECDEIVDGSTDEAFLRECANTQADHIQDLEVAIDGKEVEHLSLYRAESPFFTYGPLPENNILLNSGFPAATAGTTVSSVADGYYLMLAPLSVGDHTVNFKGAVVFTSEEDGFDFRFELDIAYFITVQPGLRY